MGSRLIAEFNPATSQYFYYTQDQIGSTRIVTDDTGTVVYAAAHDPYGGIQKLWVDAFDPKRKFSDKERDEETGLDYFGARYYAAPNWSEGVRSGSYRWLSIDPVLDRSKAIVDAQRWNLYAFCANNPLRYVDPDGRVLLCDRMYESIIAMAGPAAPRLSIVDGKLDVSKLTEEDLQDEGVMLLYLLATSSYVFGYAESTTIMTAAGERDVSGAENLDVNFDWRYRNGKSARNLPPAGVHAIVTIDPRCYWKDQATKSISVSFEAIAFHELAEAYAKIAFNLQTVYQDETRGAHQVSQQWESTLLSERPDFTAFPAGGGLFRYRY